MIIRVLIGHKRKLLRGAIAAVLARSPDIVVVAEIAHCDKAWRTVQREPVDVAIVDAALPSSIPLTELCHILNAHCAVLLVCDAEATDRQYLNLARFSPRIGFIATESAPQMLLDSIRRIALGEVVIDPKLALAVMNTSANPLTDRERQVLQLAAEGLRSTEIAGRLYLSPGTVRNHLSRVFSKTDARTRIAAIRTARERGWL